MDMIKHVRPSILANHLISPGGSSVATGRSSCSSLEILLQMPEHAELLGSAVARQPLLADAMVSSKDRAIDKACLEVRRAMQAGLRFLGRYEIDKGSPLHISATSVVVAATDYSHEHANVTLQHPRRALKAMVEGDQVLPSSTAAKALALAAKTLTQTTS